MCRRARGARGVRPETRRARRQSRHYRRSAHDIEMARLLCLKAAWTMDTQGVRAAAPLISQIKVIAPRVALEVIDQAVQMHGGGGRQPGFPAGAYVDPCAHPAPRRRARRRASARHRQERAEALHSNERAMSEAGFPDDTSRSTPGRARMSRAIAGPSDATQIPDRPVEPDLSHRDAGRALCPAPQAAGQTAQIGAYGRARISRAARARTACGFPAPRALALCEDESVVGSVFYLMSHVEGRIFWDPALPGSTRDERAAIYDAMNEALAQAARDRRRRGGPRRLWQARQLFCAAIAALERAISRERDGRDRRHEPADRLARRQRARRRRPGRARAWRLAHRQHDFRR